MVRLQKTFDETFKLLTLQEALESIAEEKYGDESKYYKEVGTNLVNLIKLLRREIESLEEEIEKMHVLLMLMNNRIENESKSGK